MRPLATLSSMNPTTRRGRSQWWFLAALLLLVAAGLLLEGVTAGFREAPRPWPGGEGILAAAVFVLVLLALVHSYARERTLARVRERQLLSDTARTRELREHYNRLVSLYDVGTSFILDRSREIHYEKIVRTCFDLFDSDRVSILLQDPGTGDLQVCAAIGPPDLSLIVGRRQRADEGVAGRVLQEGRPLLIGPDSPLLTGAEPRKTPERPRFAMVTPIAAPGRPKGVLCLSTLSEAVVYTDQDLRELQLFASNIGVYLTLLEAGG